MLACPHLPPFSPRLILLSYLNYCSLSLVWQRDAAFGPEAPLRRQGGYKLFAAHARTCSLLNDASVDADVDVDAGSTF